MNVLLVPPHADFTLAWQAPPGFRVLDAARLFAERELAPSRLKASLAEREAKLPGAGAEAARACMLLRVASELLELGGDVHRHLRACGAVLSGLSAPPSSIRLRLDDLDIVGGTTERSEDALAAALQPGAPYAATLEEAVAACAGAERVRIQFERDQQLPAALWLAQALSERHPVELAGAFAQGHWAVLSRLPPLAGVALAPQEEGPLPVVAGSPRSPMAEPLLWVGTFQRLPEGGAPWGGMVAWDALVEPSRLAASGCRLAIVAFAALGEEAVGADGTVLSRDALGAALDVLRRAGVRLVGEWWIGAPGIDEAALERTVEIIEREPPFDGIAGVRAFHWHVERPGGAWGRVQVMVDDPAPERDLVRTRPFTAPGTLEPRAAAGQMEALARRLARRAPLSPGRVAQAYAAPLAPPPAPGALIRLDADCAVVTLPASLEGKPGPASYAVNLRTGLMLAMDARLAPSLQGLRAPVSAAQALPRVPEAQRAKLVRSLVEKAVLTEVER